MLTLFILMLSKVKCCSLFVYYVKDPVFGKYRVIYLQGG